MMSRGLARGIWLSVVSGLGGAIIALPGVAGDLPPPPSSMEAVADAQLFLELVVNQMDTGRVIAVDQRAGQLYVPASALQDVGMKLPGEPSGSVALDQIPGLHSEYDSHGQRLLLDVPPSWLQAQFIGNRNTYPRTQAMSSFGALLNYDLYFNDTDEGGSYLAAWNEVRLFDNWGTLSNTGQYRQTLADGVGSSTLNNGYRRYDTTWRFSDDEQLLTYEAITYRIK